MFSGLRNAAAPGNECCQRSGLAIFSSAVYRASAFADPSSFRGPACPVKVREIFQVITLPVKSL
jgi:hypothetical protein